MNIPTRHKAFVTLCLCSLISAAALHGAEIPPLLHATAEQGGYSVDLSALDGDTISLELPTGGTVEYKRRDMAGGREEKGTWTGIVEGQPASVAILAEFNGVISGSVSHGGKSYNLRPSGDGRYTLDLVEPESGNQGCGCEHPPAAPSQPSEPLEQKAFPAAAEAQMAEINPADVGIPHLDVMFVYTSAARTQAGGENAIQALMRSCIASGNLTLANSGINLRLRFVGSTNTIQESGWHGWRCATITDSRNECRQGLFTRVRKSRVIRSASGSSTQGTG